MVLPNTTSWFRLFKALTGILSEIAGDLEWVIGPPADLHL
jgi:hypothetical protein